MTIFCFSDSESDENQNLELNDDNQEKKLLPININNENLCSINIEDDGLSSQNESDESQDRFSYKEFDSGGNTTSHYYLYFENCLSFFHLVFKILFIHLSCEYTFIHYMYLLKIF